MVVRLARIQLKNNLIWETRYLRHMFISLLFYGHALMVKSASHMESQK